MPAKLFELRIEFRIKPVSAADGCLQVVDDRRPGDTAKVAKRIFQTADERLARLPPHRLAVTLARMREHRAKQMRPAPFSILHDPRALAKIHLQLGPRL